MGGRGTVDLPVGGNGPWKVNGQGHNLDHDLLLIPLYRQCLRSQWSLLSPRIKEEIEALYWVIKFYTYYTLNQGIRLPLCWC